MSSLTGNGGVLAAASTVHAVGSQLDLTRLAFRIDVLRGALPDLAVESQDPFEPRFASGPMCLGCVVGVDDHLEDAGVIAKVDEDETAVVAAPVDPAEYGRGVPRIGHAWCPAVGAVGGHDVPPSMRMTVSDELADRHRLLGATVEVTDHGAIAGHLVLANNDSNAGADASCGTQLAIEPPLRDVEDGPSSCIAKQPCHRRGRLLLAWLHGADEHVGCGRSRRDGAQGPRHHQDPLHAERVAGRGRGGETEQLGKPVVAASPAERALSPLQCVVPELEDGVAVVVEPTDEPVVVDRVDPAGLEGSMHGREAFAAGSVERVPEQRSLRNQPGVALAIEQSEWIRVQPAPAVIAQRRLEWGVVGDERRAVPRPVLGAAERVELQMDPADAECSKEAPGHLDDLGIQRRRAFADALDADLRELMLPPCLGPLRAKERAGVLHPHRADLLVEVRAQHCAQCARRSLGA